jgi:hypothetical protein
LANHYILRTMIECSVSDDSDSEFDESNVVNSGYCHYNESGDNKVFHIDLCNHSLSIIQGYILYKIW